MSSNVNAHKGIAYSAQPAKPSGMPRSKNHLTTDTCTGSRAPKTPIAANAAIVASSISDSRIRWRVEGLR